MKNEKEILKGIVIRSSKNIMMVQAETNNGIKELECRIKGKVLKGHEDVYNPIAPGDRVIVERAISANRQNDSTMILSVEERRNIFSRYNQKGECSQLLAANIDIALCLCTPVSPPFRPRFLDRVLLQADAAGIEAIVICNKIDLDYDDIDIDERLEEYVRIGYRIIRVSAKTGEGLDNLRGTINGKTCVLIGQSGVGKSSLLNSLCPGLNIKESELNEKYDRGVHTTTMSVMYQINEGTRIIDTPGVRLFVPDGIKADEVILHMKEFAPLAGKCSFGLSCSHKTERGCKIMEAVAAGVIHEDRYESFIRIIEELTGKEDGEY